MHMLDTSQQNKYVPKKNIVDVSTNNVENSKATRYNVKLKQVNKAKNEKHKATKEVKKLINTKKVVSNG